MSSIAAPMACPACSAAPLADPAPAPRAVGGQQITLSLPEIHCAACISGVERVLLAHPGIRRARVNLTLKRAMIEADPGVTAQDLVAHLTAKGFKAFELDADSLGGANDATGRDLLMRLGVAGFAMMNVMLLSVAVWSGATDATRDLFHWISATIAIPTILFSAQPFFRNAMSALRAARLNMDVPISLAILLAAGMSVYETAHSGAHAYFDAALSLTFFLLAGRYLDYRTRSVARSAARELAALEVPRALRIVECADVMTPVAKLAVGDLVRVLPGARVPVDGVIEAGASEMDRALLTGESLPVAALTGDAVHAGEINLTGMLQVRVTAAGEDSSLHRLTELVAMAESSRNRYTSLADKAAAIYAPVVHILSFVAFAVWWWISGDVRLSLNIAVAVLIITCPCALGLAVPAVTTAASGRLFGKGMLIKNATALERLAEVDAVVFDKTGTLTQGTPVIRDLSGFARDDLRVAAAMAQGSAHPLAIALGAEVRRLGIEPVALDQIVEVPGQGIEAQYQGKPVRLGRAGWVGAKAVEDTATYLRIGANEPLVFRAGDQLRDGAAEAVGAFKAQGKRVVLLSGDSIGAVAKTADRLGIEEFRAEILPAEKAAFVQDLSGQGCKVLMIGDGLNDTGALAAAHASISPASALEAARAVSDIVLLGNSLAPLGEAVGTAQSATRRIRENFGIAAAYNAVAIPVALLGFATPLAAALAMSLSSISVSLNALRLR